VTARYRTVRQAASASGHRRASDRGARGKTSPITRVSTPSLPRLYRAGVRSAVRGAGLPYGYTVTMWCSGQVLIHFEGTPGLALVGLFAAGALAGYALLQLTLAPGAEADGQDLGASANWARGGCIQVAAVPGTVAAVAAAGALLRPGGSWPFGGAATVLGYLGITGIELALQARG